MGFIREARDLAWGVLAPLLIVAACVGASAVVIYLGVLGKHMARVEEENRQAEEAARLKAAENLLLHGQTFAPER